MLSYKLIYMYVHSLLKYFKRVMLLNPKSGNPTLSNLWLWINHEWDHISCSAKLQEAIEIFIHIWPVKKIFIFLTQKKEIFIFEIIIFLIKDSFKFVCGVRFKIYMNVKLDPKKMGLFSLFSFYMYSLDHLNNDLLK